MAPSNQNFQKGTQNKKNNLPKNNLPKFKKVAKVKKYCPHQEHQFSYYEFVDTLAATYYKLHPRAINRVADESKFYKHGLWPQLKCELESSEKTVDFSQVTDLTSLKKEMPDLGDTKKTVGFLKYQYRKHGFKTNLAPEVYFSKISELLQQYDMYQRSVLEGLMNIENVTAKDVFDTVKNSLHVDPSVRTRTIDGKKYLLQVSLAVNTSFELMNMPKSHYRDCKESDLIYFN